MGITTLAAETQTQKDKMKLFLLFLIASTARVEAQTQAQLEAGVKLLDKNSNGFIEKDEAGVSGGTQAKWKQLVQLGDCDKDGKLSISEFAGAGKMTEACSGASSVTALFSFMTLL